MPNQSLNQIDNFNTIENWLNINLTIPNSITPVPSQILNVPTEKGIYFWFMKSNAYEKLSLFIPVVPLESKYTIDLDSQKYDLVYLGTAGTGKTGKSHLKERLEWHIDIKKNNHKKSFICNGIISTLRAGVGSLISSDLSLSTTKDNIDVLFKDYFKVYFITYLEYEENLIDLHESILIKNLKPFFNLKNNPNAKLKALKNVTQDYKSRRKIVINDSRNNLFCNIKESEDDKKKLQSSPSAIDYIIHESVIELDSQYIDVVIERGENVAEVVRSIRNLPESECKLLLFNSIDENQYIYSKKNQNGWRTTGSKNQNIYTYFSAKDDIIMNGNTIRMIRWKIIQNEMISKNINEITLRIMLID